MLVAQLSHEGGAGSITTFAIVTDVTRCCDSFFLQAGCQSLQAHHQVLNNRAVLLGKSEKNTESDP